MGLDVQFDFIKDGPLRDALESDYHELRTCAEQGAWKAVHVLAGSIVEAVLVEYLAGSGNAKKDPLTMTLGELIAACAKAGVISSKTAELSSAVKAYRNLIHPGRAVRLNERADSDGALVAQSLVSMVVREVVASQQETYGLTAEQIVNKFESDPSALGIAQHLLSEAQEKEVERLLVTVLPARYFNEVDRPFADPRILESHAKLYRAAFNHASDAVRQAVMKRYLQVLREEPGPQVRVYEEEFFRATDLAFVTGKDRELAKAHLFARLREEPSAALVRAADGIGSFLTKKDVVPFVDGLIRAVVYHSEKEGLADMARGCLERQADITPRSRDPEIVKRLDDWVRMFDRRGSSQQAEAVKEIQVAYDLFAAAAPNEN